MRARPTGPDIEVLPLKKRIDRPPQMEGKEMGFGPEKQDWLRRWRVFANRQSKPSLFPLRFVTR